MWRAIFRVMLLKRYGRGWVSSDDPGANYNYYLINSIWSWNISPVFFRQDNHSVNSFVGGEGTIAFTIINNGDGGVQLVYRVML